MNRRQRRMQRALRGTPSSTPKLQDKLSAIKSEIQALEQGQSARFDEVVDRLAEIAYGMSQDSDDSNKNAAAAARAINELVSVSLLKAFVRHNWRGATAETIADVLGHEVVNRISAKRTLIFALAFVDKLARKVVAVFENKASDQESEQQILSAIMGMVDDEEGLEPLENELVQLNWRGCTHETFIEVLGKAVHDRTIELRSNREALNTILSDELIKLPPGDREKAYNGFRARLDREYSTLKIRDQVREMLRKQGLDHMPPEDQKDAVDKLVDLVVNKGMSMVDATHTLALREIDNMKTMNPTLAAQMQKLDDQVSALADGATPEAYHEAMMARTRLYSPKLADTILKSDGRFVHPNLPNDPNCVHVDAQVMELLRPFANNIQHDLLEQMKKALPLESDKQLELLKQMIRERATPLPPPPVDSYPLFLRRKASDTPPGWFEHDLMRFGVKLWEQTYKLKKTDAEANEYARRVVHEIFPQQGLDQRLLLTEMLNFSAAWAIQAFQRITTSHTFAAALMCSDADRESLMSLEKQWSAFLVIVPNGMLVVHDTEVGTVIDYTRILVSTYADRATMIVIALGVPGRAYASVFEDASTLPDLLLQESKAPADAQGDRMMVMAKRLVAGLLLAMQTKENFKDRVVAKRAAKPGRKDADEPEHRIVMVGHPITVDCRASVKAFIEGTSKKKHGAYVAPSVQVVVTGHWRRQVCGVGRRDRKTIWIQPFYRGPADAPILVHAKKLKAAAEDQE